MILLIAIATFIAGLAIFWLITRLKLGSFHSLAQKIIETAEREVEKEELSFQHSLKDRAAEQERAFKAQQISEEKRLQKRETSLERQLTLIETKLKEIEQREEALQKREKKLISQERKLNKERQALTGLSPEEAKELYLKAMSQELTHESAALVRKMEREIKEECETRAKRILATTIQRLAMPTLSDLAVVTVSLPNQEIKGRVIGREGRNIRTLEKATGVNFLIDDTPNAVVISGFDPIRKEIARRALTELIKDGRIHPTRIEECVASTEESMDHRLHELGQEAAQRANVHHLHSELITLLGKLYFRHSLGQNVLEHSVEVSALMGGLAAELDLDEDLARRIGLLHDIGKALTHESKGSHALNGRDLALKYDEIEVVANGIGCHHEEIPPLTIEGSLCGTADALSGGRSGARIEAMEHYLKRSQKLETLVHQIEGVDKAYALQAGREVRVIVSPEHFDDDATLLLARHIAKKIEKEMSYPGKIKVTVIREQKAIEYAS